RKMRIVLADAQLAQGNFDAAVATLRQGLHSSPADVVLLHTLAMLLLDRAKIKEAAEVIEQLRKLGNAEPLVQFLQGLQAYQEQRWLAARDALDHARARLEAFPDLARQAEYHLAECYAQLGQRDQQLAACRRAIAIDRNFTAARLKTAELLLAAGEVDEALALHRETMQAEKPAAGARLLWARLLLADNLRRNPSQRDWTELESLLKGPPATAPDALEWTLLHADVLAAQGSPQRAEELLAKARQADPSQPSLWAAAIVFAERRQAWDDVASLAEEAAKHCGDCVPLRLARARQTSAREPAAVPALLEKLSLDVDRFPPDHRLRLWRGLLAVATAHKVHSQSMKLCERIIEARPQDLEIRSLQIDLAWRLRDPDAMRKATDAVRTLEGQSALWHYGEALGLQLAEGKDRELKSSEALKHLEQARVLRPNWSPPLLAAAAIHHQQNDLAKAGEEYRQAIDLGVRDPEVVRRAVGLLQQQRRFDEANKLVQRVEADQPGITLALGRVGSELSLRRADLAGALAAAREAAKGSSDPQDHLWLGQLLASVAARANDQEQPPKTAELLEEAEQALRRGLELDRNRPAAWILLVAFLAATGRTQQAAATVEEAQRQLQGEDRVLVLAQCHKALGRPDKAEACYRQAVAARPRDPVVLRSAAEFYLQHNKPQDAEIILNAMLRLGDPSKTSDHCWARRGLAAVLLQRGGYRNLRLALPLVEQNLQSPQAAGEDRCMKALLLASHPQRVRHREAAGILEDVLGQDRSLLKYRLVAAEIYRKLGDWSAEARHMRTFLASNPSHAAALAEYVRGLLEHGELQDAAEWLNRLEQIAPESQAAVRLRMVWLLKRGKYQDAIERLNAYRNRKTQSSDAQANDASVAASPKQTAARSRETVELLQSLAPTAAQCKKDPQASAFLAAAEVMLRDLAAADPAEALVLAGWLRQLGRIGEAVEVVERHWEKASFVTLQKTLLELLAPCLEDRKLAQRLLAVAAAAGRKHDRTVPLVLIEAELQTSLGRYPEAESCYREALKAQPSNVIAQNNLAVLLALNRKDLDEALRLASQAIDETGPLATLLDSLAMVHLARGKPEEAIRHLDAAIADDPTASAWFHRAQACDRLGKREAAAAAFKKAEQLAQGPARIHVLEKPEYDRLKTLISSGS
ncbi:MAG: tetratricopeptide repeat protein, partial [Pirellulales bacterium]|nr:tetratricopeptide repeat protein [Pirellulales bacterium]